MTEQEIKLARERYSKVVPDEKKENLKQIKNELLALEQNDAVQKYIELQKESVLIESEINDPENLSFAFDEITLLTQKSSNLYLAIGYFSVATGLEGFTALSEENPNSHYKYYINVETSKLEVISKENVEKFEKSNIVIDANLVSIKKGKRGFLEKLKEIRNIYFSYLLDEEQQVAIQKTKKKVEKHEI